MSEAFSFSFENVDNSIILRIKSVELHIDRITQLGKQIFDVLKDQPDKLIIDLEHTSYLDSAALGMIFKINDQMESHDSRLYLTGINNTISMVLSITKADKIIRIAESVDSAIKD